MKFDYIYAGDLFARLFALVDDNTTYLDRDEMQKTRRDFMRAITRKDYTATRPYINYIVGILADSVGVDIEKTNATKKLLVDIVNAIR